MNGRRWTAVNSRRPLDESGHPTNGRAEGVVHPIGTTRIKKKYQKKTYFLLYFLEFSRVLLGFIGFYKVLLGFTEIDRVLLGFI